MVSLPRSWQDHGKIIARSWQDLGKASKELVEHVMDLGKGNMTSNAGASCFSWYVILEKMNGVVKVFYDRH